MAVLVIQDELSCLLSCMIDVFSRKVWYETLTVFGDVVSYVTNVTDTVTSFRNFRRETIMVRAHGFSISLMNYA